MKNIIYLCAFAILSFGSCQTEETILGGPLIPELEPEPQVGVVDSINVELVNLQWPNPGKDYNIVDFTARLPGYIWGCIAKTNDHRELEIFSYDISSNQVQTFTAPDTLDVPYFQIIEGSSNGKLYLHSSGVVKNKIAVFDTRSSSWSSITLPGFVGGITIDESNDEVWIAHNNGISRVQNDSVITYDESNSALRRIISGPNNSFFGFVLAVDVSGTVWYANSNIIYTFNDEEWSVHPLSPLSDTYIVTHIVPDEIEGVLIKTPRENLLQLNASKVIKSYNAVPDLIEPARGAINILGRSVDSSIIYSHMNGFSFYAPRKDSVFQVSAQNSNLPTLRDGLKLSRDLDDNIWIGGGNTLGILPDEWK
ncbi:NHL repeat-containing protein [Neolewinella antarctica]|uniref:Uncharacterized protein n=1 Tax=Neolewinella antarctica TaxID=442734 RepID=A0ABX0XG80_9BACT|nr:hypothetical protein [Neolewinella antarctica]NJC27883.1 hypothetical protein [Neolewinella antarctica]